jgi:hypothetical protein
MTMPREPSQTTASIDRGTRGHASPRRLARAFPRARSALLVMFLVLGCGSGSEVTSSSREAPPSSLEPARTTSRPLEAVSDLGHYRVAIRPAALPIPLHQMHDWIVRIEPLEESSEIPTAVQFDGGMPSHGHGFVTQPRVTQNLGHGEFRVEGVKFHMPGVWELRVIVTSRSATDRVSLAMTITP